MQRVLLTGASGFVGARLWSTLVKHGVDVVGASRDPTQARAKLGHDGWVRMDVTNKRTVQQALQGCQAAIYLVHGMADVKHDYEAREQAAATLFAEMAHAAGIERIVYLGGIEPKGVPSKHLRSRLATGAALRGGKVPVFELGASMIVGVGSESWRIVRDLSSRLPVMVLPRWLRSRSQPIAIDDVLFALSACLTLPVELAGRYALPGPETLTAKEILLRVAALRGTRPLTLDVPLVSPRLSSYWIELVTSANQSIARELVEGLRSDLVAADDGFFALVQDYSRLTFDVAARRALEEEAAALPGRTRLFEGAMRRLSPRVGRR